LLFSLKLNSQTIINLDDAPSMPLHKELLGANTGLFYSDVMGERDENNVMINSYFSPELIKEIDSLSIGHIRFPGGNSANHYHFYGRGGYGTDSFELLCREGFLPQLSVINQYGINDGRHAENFAPRVKEMMQGLGKVNEKPNLHYIINIMTHFYYGDFKGIENGLNLLLLGRSKLVPYLLFNFNALNLSQMDIIAEELRLLVIQNKTAFDLAKGLYMQNEGFRKRFDENMAAIHYYHDNNIPISHIEMGNEIYADFMLLDEDLSTIEFDCTTADSTTNFAAPLSYLNIQQYSMALLKYYFVTSLYEDSIKAAFPNTKTGLVLAPMRPTIGINEFFVASEMPRGILSLNANYLWNKFVSSFSQCDGVVTHLYLQNLSNCSIHSLTSEDTITRAFNAIMDFFIETSFNTSLEFQYLSMQPEIQKEHWVTEWNVNGRNAASNTYMHAQFVLRFMLKFLEWNKNNPNRKIDITTYFNLSTFQNYNYCMMRTGYDTEDIYHIDKQNLYYPMAYLNRAIQTGSHMIDLADSIWTNQDSIRFYTFYNPTKKEVSLIYINYAKKNKKFSLDSTKFQIDGKNEQWIIESFRALQADKLLSTDFGCPEITPAIGEEATIRPINSLESNLEIIIPKNSFGEIILKREEIPTNAKNFTREEFAVFPNPSSGNFLLQTQNISQGNLNIYNISGKILVSKANIIFPTEVNITLPSGTYFIEINNNHQRWQKKLIIAK
jgi:hypothetical protein